MFVHRNPQTSSSGSPEFQKLKELGGDKLANDVAVAWQGDARDYQRSGGKGFQPLVAQMLNDRVVERRYGIQLTPELRTVLSRIIQLSHHAFPDTNRLKATTNAPHSGDVWGMFGLASAPKLNLTQLCTKSLRQMF